jgi:hypothetical protein
MDMDATCGFSLSLFTSVFHALVLFVKGQHSHFFRAKLCKNQNTQLKIAHSMNFIFFAACVEISVARDSGGLADSF